MVPIQHRTISESCLKVGVLVAVDLLETIAMFQIER